jgi:FMN reductase (NADPH)/FMN reductase [NAD(P)H]
MNPVIELILNRKSVRAFEEREISPEVRDEILSATMRAPTAGNMMLYSIIDVQDPNSKRALVKTCDDQAFIAQAPWVLLFLADYQRWYDGFLVSGVDRLCEQRKVPMRKPEEGDMFLACCDAVIAAQTAVITAESLGVGSCYIGDITEHYEVHKELFHLPQYVVPICLLCFGYPTGEQKARERTQRFQRDFLVFEDRYRRLDKESFDRMVRERQKRAFQDRENLEGATNFGQLTYLRKFDVDYARERNRSVRAILKAWRE